MEIVKAFNANKLHTEITIKGTCEEPLFRASDIGLVLNISNIRTSINDFNESEKITYVLNTTQGEQSVTFLTEKGLYKVLFRSRKPIAEKFKDWVCEVIKEIRISGKYELEKVLKEKNVEIKEKDELNDKLIKQKSLERQNILLKEFDSSGPLVYIVKVKTYKNGTYVVKIGESRIGISDRFNDHKSSYEECELLDCFSVKLSKHFEKFLHNHDDININRVTNLKRHESERELFLVGKELSYCKLIKIINTNIKNYDNINNTSEIEKLKLENKNLKLINEMKSSDNLYIKELFNLNKELVNLNKNLLDEIILIKKSNKEILDKVNSLQTKTTSNFNENLKTLGPRLQKINPEKLILVKTYESIAECIKENNKLKRSSICKAVKENTIYQDFRWAFVDRELDPNKIHKVEPTKITKIQHNGYIAKLNKEKTEIINVYLDRKTACLENNYNSIASLDNPVKNGTETNGNYYMLYENCNKELQKNFVKKYSKEPLLYKNGVGQYDLKNNLLNEFVSKHNCCQTIGIGDKSLSKALEKNIQYNDYFYKYLDDKVKCF
jgi:prophage antirepressor-like protein